MFFSIPSKFEMLLLKNILAPGTYVIGIGLYENRSYIGGNENLSQITVVENDFYSTGKLPDSGQGHILLDSIWNITSS